MASCIKHHDTNCRAARRGRAFALGLLATFALVPRDAVADDTIKIGLLRTSQNGPLFVAVERGYFRADRLDAQLIFFDAAQPVAVATVSGSVDVGAAGTSAGFYSLAGEGALRVIAGQSREIRGFPNNIVLASESAFAAGLKSLNDLTGHSVAIATIGGPPHYVISVLAEQHGVDLATLRFLPFQTLPNMVSALIGGQADASVMPASTALPIVQRDDAMQLAIVANEMRS